MATYQAQIEGLTSISTGTTPTTTELTTFLTDGAKDVINKIITIRPDEAFKFATELVNPPNLLKSGVPSESDKAKFLTLEALTRLLAT